MQVFYQIKYLHTKLYFWCQAGSPIFFFFFPFASFFQPPLPTFPPSPSMIQTVFVHKKKLKISPTLGEGVQFVILYTVIYLSGFNGKSAPVNEESKLGRGGLSLRVTHPVAFGRKMCFFFSSPFKIFLAVVDIGRGLGRLLIQVSGWRVKYLEYLFNILLRHPFPSDVTW